MQETARIHTVTFLSPGTFVSEETTRPIGSWDAAAASEMAAGIVERHGARPYAFYFSTLLTARDVPDGMGGLLRVEPRVLERSGLHFLGGEVLTLAEVEERNDPAEETLRSNMRWNWPIVCETKNGFRHIAPFSEKDMVVDASGQITQRGDVESRIAYRAAVLGRQE